MSSSKKYRLVQRSMTMQERLPQGKYRKLSEDEITLDWLHFSRQSFLGDGRNTSPKLTSNVESLDPIDSVLMKNQPAQHSTTRSMPENMESTLSLKRRQPKFLKVFSHRLSRKSLSKEDVRLSVTEEVSDSTVPEKKVDNERDVSADESHVEQIQPNVSVNEESQKTRNSKEKRKDSKSSSSSSSSSSLSSKDNWSNNRINRDSVPIDEYLLKYGLVPKSVNSNSVPSDRSSDRINSIADGNRNKNFIKDGEERKNMSIFKTQINTSQSTPFAESDIKIESKKRIKNSSITSTSSASSASTSESNIKLTPTKIGIVPIDQYLNPHDFVSRSARNVSTEGARGKSPDGRKGSESNKGNVPAMEKKNLESVALISKSDLDLVQKRKQKDKRKSYDHTRHSCISVGIQAPDDNAITFWDARYDVPNFGTDTKTFKMHALVTDGTDEIKFKADNMDTDTVNMRMNSEIPLMVREIPEPSLSIVHIGKATLTPREVEVMHSESTEGPILQRRNKFENSAQNIGPSTYDMPDDKGNYISVENNIHNIQGYNYTTVSFHEKPPLLDDATLDSLQESCVDDAACLSPANTIESNNEQMPSGGTAVQIAQAGGYYRAITNDNTTRPRRSSAASNSSSSSSNSKSSEGSSLTMDRANSSEKAYEEHNLGHANTEKAGNGKMDAVNNGHYRKKAYEHPRYDHLKSKTETIKSDLGHHLGVRKTFISGVSPSSDNDGLEQEKLKSSPAATFDDDHCMGDKRKLQFDSSASFEENHRECKEGQQKSQFSTSIGKDHLHEANENTSDIETSALETSHSESEISSTGQANGMKVKIKTRVDKNDNHGTGAVNETDDRNISIETEIACGDMADVVTQSTFIRPVSPASSDISREIARVSDPCESDHSTSSTASFNSSSPSTSSGSKNGNRSSHKLEKNSPKMSQDRPRQVTYNCPVFYSENNQDGKFQVDSTSTSSSLKSKDVSEKLPDKLRSELHDEKKLLKQRHCGKDVSLSNSSFSSTDNSSENARRRRQSSSSSSSQNSHQTEELIPRSTQFDLQGDPYIKSTHAEFSGGKESDEFGEAEIGERIEQLELNQENEMPSASTYNYSEIHSALNTLDNVIHTSGVHVRTHSENAGTLRTAGGHFVVVAIDFGTTYSGYAFSFTRDPDSIYMMRKWEGGDPGVINQKTLTTLLLTPDEKFHSFGYAARDFFHDLDPDEATHWLYFEKFKMMLHYNANLCSTTLLTASNGRQVPALTVFSHALRFFKERVLEELSDQSGMKIMNEDIRWVLTVPAIWKAQAKQFMRQASYDAGLVSPAFPDQLLVALEPEVASIYCRKLRMHQLIPEGPPIKSPLRSPRKSQPDIHPNKEMACKDFVTDSNLQRSPCCSSSNLQRSPCCSSSNLQRSACCSSLDTSLSPSDTVDSIVQGMRYMVVDCGGGTVDITVHEIDTGGRLNELHRATGGPYGSVGVDLEFEKLLHGIFGVEFIEQFKLKCPAGWVDLMINFESRKRSASPYSASSLNVSLPFSFINCYKKSKGSHIESIIKKYGDKEIRWSSQGMLRLSPEAMRRLFLPTLDRIKQTIGDVLNDPETRGVKYLFLVGGFAESAFLQTEVRQEFRHILQVIIPQEVSLTIVKGAVLFALDPTVVNLRRSRLTYGVGVLNRFDPNKHPIEKKVTKDGIDWCTDVFDKFVMIDQPIAQGDVVARSYTPARPSQKTSQINVYCTEEEDVMFITDIGVKKCGTLALELEPLSLEAREPPVRREIQTRMMFGETEIKVSAIDMSTGTNVYCSIDFMNR